MYVENRFDVHVGLVIAARRRDIATPQIFRRIKVTVEGNFYLITQP